MPEVFRTTDDGAFDVVRSEADMAPALAEVQAVCFPTLSPAEVIRAEHYRSHIAVYPEGQHAVRELATGRIVACSTDFRTRMDFGHYQHRYIDAVAGNTLTAHVPDGDWMYGADIGVHPDYQGRRLSTLLYIVRQELIRRLGLRGHITGGLPRGYHLHQRELAIEEYVNAVVRETITDPTLSVQLRRGYLPYGIVPGYVDDPSTGGHGVLLIWRNPDLRTARRDD